MTFTEIKQQKDAYNEHMRRVKDMPKEYQFVYNQMFKYIYKTNTLTEQQVIDLHREVIDLFEVGITDGNHVLEITGRDVASFCDQLTSQFENYDQTVQREVEEAIRHALEKTK